MPRGSDFSWSRGIDGEMVKGMSWKLGFLPEVGCMEFQVIC